MAYKWLHRIKKKQQRQHSNDQNRFNRLWLISPDKIISVFAINSLNKYNVVFFFPKKQIRQHDGLVTLYPAVFYHIVLTCWFCYHVLSERYVYEEKSDCLVGCKIYFFPAEFRFCCVLWKKHIGKHPTVQLMQRLFRLVHVAHK